MTLIPPALAGHCRQPVLCEGFFPHCLAFSAKCWPGHNFTQDWLCSLLGPVVEEWPFNLRWGQQSDATSAVMGWLLSRHILFSAIALWITSCYQNQTVCMRAMWHCAAPAWLWKNFTFCFILRTTANTTLILRFIIQSKNKTNQSAPSISCKALQDVRKGLWVSTCAQLWACSISWQPQDGSIW